MAVGLRCAANSVVGTLFLEEYSQGPVYSRNPTTRFTADSAVLGAWGFGFS